MGSTRRRRSSKAQDTPDRVATARDLSALAREIGLFVAEREWERFHTPKNLASSVAIEAAELMEIFQWLDPGQSDRAGLDPVLMSRVKDESADVFAYLLSLANRLGFDLGQALLDKLERNRRKYPVERFKGRFGENDL
ncbi:MAG: nucleotide pyrophosphohydrolase [Candidatus Riflebacteria bacterium]|nr:nucleotide pyrophosphohydrolase [Candidatus Riflebacteria bacterium]